MSKTFFQKRKYLTLLFISSFLFLPLSSVYLYCHVEHERTVETMSEEEFKRVVQERAQGLVGCHRNIDLTPMIPASENVVANWSQMPTDEKARLSKKQEEMFREGKITMIVMAGGEATRFGGPKTFMSVSDALGEFLEIKAANLNWVHHQYKTNVPLYILSSEKRLAEFKSALAQRQYYGLDPNTFHWFVQGTIDSFTPLEAEVKAQFKDEELKTYLGYAALTRQANPDGIFRFKGERRTVPSGHFDVIAAFIVSGYLSEALSLGVEFSLIVNIDNLQAILKNDGMIAYFAEKGVDFGFLLAEKNLSLSITDKATGKLIENKCIVRFRDQIISFDGIQEFSKQAEKGDYRYVINQEKKTVDIYDMKTGQQLETEIKMKAEIGGTLVQAINEKGEPMGAPFMKESFELPMSFNHAHAPFFNTNTILVNLRSLLRFLDISEQQLAHMSFEERFVLVRTKLLDQIKVFFEFKNHLVTGEYPELGVVKDGITKIPVVQLARILLQVAHLKRAKVDYIFASRASVFAPVKEPEDKKIAAENNWQSLQQFTLYAN